MATIGRCGGRAPWISMAAFGLTGCLTALSHGMAGAAEPLPGYPQQVAPAIQGHPQANYYSTTPANTVPASRSTAQASGYTASSALNYYTHPASTNSAAVSTQRYASGAVAASSSRRSNHAYSRHTQPSHGRQHAYMSQPTAAAYPHTSRQPQAERKQGILGRAFKKAPAPAKPATPSISPTKLSGTTQSGTASWYGGKFHGGKTASGERYDMHSMTAAHRSLPFGTLVRVKNLNNNRECVVRVNNRGPFTKGRILDVSKAAAQELGFMSRGLTKVHMQVLGKHEK